jgi:hypothetical protein
MNGPSSFEVHGLGNNLYLIQRKWRGKREGYQGWQCLITAAPGAGVPLFHELPRYWAMDISSSSWWRSEAIRFVLSGRIRRGRRSWAIYAAHSGLA